MDMELAVWALVWALGCAALGRRPGTCYERGHGPDDLDICRIRMHVDHHGRGILWGLAPPDRTDPSSQKGRENLGTRLISDRVGESLFGQWFIWTARDLDEV